MPGKTGLIQELTDRARAERGLPPAPVWEEALTGVGHGIDVDRETGQVPRHRTGADGDDGRGGDRGDDD